MNPSLTRRVSIDGFAERYHQTCLAPASFESPGIAVEAFRGGGRSSDACSHKTTFPMAGLAAGSGGTGIASRVSTVHRESSTQRSWDG